MIKKLSILLIILLCSSHGIAGPICDQAQDKAIKQMDRLMPNITDVALAVCANAKMAKVVIITAQTCLSDGTLSPTERKHHEEALQLGELSYNQSIQSARELGHTTCQ